MKVYVLYYPKTSVHRYDMRVFSSLEKARKAKEALHPEPRWYAYIKKVELE